VLAFALVDLEHVERQFRRRLDALPPAARAELLHVLTLPDLERAERIGEFGGHPETRRFGELLTDLEEDKAPKCAVWGLLPEVEWAESATGAGVRWVR
jgi:hypothetical protein